MTVLVLVEHDRGVANEASFEMLTLAWRLAGRLGVSLEAILVGEEAGPLAERLPAYGVTVTHLVRHERLGPFAPAAWAESVVQLMAAARPTAVLAAGTDVGNEVMAHVGARTDLPVAANCTEVTPGGEGEPFLVTRLRWGGSLLEEARLYGTVKLLTVAPHAIRAEPHAAGAAAVGSYDPTLLPFTPALADSDTRVRVVRRVEPAGGRVSLVEARVVVGGGRGVGSAEGFAALTELADLMGGAVGCSRVVTSLGWRPHADQVGQTGVRIAPDLYIACGISGAIQHIVGCKGAKRLLAINTDPEAPIVDRADYAVIADVQAFIPALIAEVRKLKSAGEGPA